MDRTTRGVGSENRDLPGFVVLLDPRGGPIGGAPNWGAGYMPATYQGTQFRVSLPTAVSHQEPQHACQAV